MKHLIIVKRNIMRQILNIILCEKRKIIKETSEEERRELLDRV